MAIAEDWALTPEEPVRIVNVASVPQRSPFRYPGGKTWLIPYIRLWLRRGEHDHSELIEPFAGGAIVGLTAAFEKLVQQVTLVERDPGVSAVWQTILNGDAEWLADRIVNFPISIQAVRKILAAQADSSREIAFATLLRNRVQRGGILAPGAGLMKEGENGRGICSRWYAQTLRKRILAISAVKDRIRFIEGDGVEIMRQNADRKGVAFFIDPPYTIAGRRLYFYSDIDHGELFKVTSRLAGDFLMTYDNVQEIRGLAERFGFQTKLIPMKNTHHAKMTELLIGRDLEWLEAPQAD